MNRMCVAVNSPAHWPWFLCRLFQKACRGGIADWKIMAILMIAAVTGTTQVLLVDDLTDGKTVAKVSGGSFTAAGWACKGGNLAFDCGKTVGGGGAQVWVTNFNPPKQSTSDKHMFFVGRTAQIDDDASEKADWWAYRAGNNYSGGSEGTMKVLSNVRGQTSDDKQETRVLGSQTYSLSSTYRLKATWGSSKVTYYLDGKSFCTHSWGSKPFEIRFVNVGKDIYHGYSGLSGPVYVRFVMWAGSEPSNLDQLSEKGATTAAALRSALHLSAPQTPVFKIANGRLAVIGQLPHTNYNLLGSMLRGTVMTDRRSLYGAK